MKSTKGLRVLKIVGATIFYLIIALLLLFSIATLSRKREDQIPNIFGFGFLAVHADADSMVGDNKDSFNPGDLIFIKVLNKADQDKLDLQKLKEDGTVITFFDPYIKQFNTHRVVGYDPIKDSIETKGDNKNYGVDELHLEKVDVLGIYSGKLKGFGKPISFMQKPIGFGLVVIFPMFALLIFQGYGLFKNLYVVKEDKLKETMEKERELMKQELLAELSKEKKEEGEE